MNRRSSGWRASSKLLAHGAAAGHPFMPRRPFMPKPFRLYICSDIHASERAWRKLLNATRANTYKADAVLIAGDLTGKALIPIVSSADGRWTAELLGSRRTATTKAELAAL